MISVKYVSAEYQQRHNSVGDRFVLVDNRVYRTDDPKRYIATIKRNNPKRVFQNLCECNAKGIPLQVKINWGK